LATTTALGSENASGIEQESIQRFEVNYRGIFQKTLAYRITKDLVYIAHSQGRTAFSNGRYSDDPQRNGVPCANFAFFSDEHSEEELEAIASAKMDIDRADVVSVLDDTMVKGLEPWGHYGIRPINEKVVPNGILLVISRRTPEDLVKFLDKKPFSYKLAIVPGDASFAGLWYYRDDGTDVKMLGAIAKVAPNIINYDKAKEYVRKTYKTDQKIRAFETGYNSVIVTEVGLGQGIEWPYPKPTLPAWNEFEEGIAVKAVPNQFRIGPRGLARNPDYKRGTSKTQRPVVRFDLCTKCTLCWYECPDECFDPTPDGFYDVNYEYCTGCGRCAEVCPVNECIVMVDELNFSDNKSPWESFRKDPKSYTKDIEEKKGKGRMMPSFVTGKGETTSDVHGSVAFKETKY
jgi:pyruvate ferredoxin oxidoreductase delta subunit